MRNWPRWTFWLIQAADAVALFAMLYVLVGTDVQLRPVGSLPAYYWLALAAFFVLEVLSYMAYLGGILPPSMTRNAAYSRLGLTTIMLVLFFVQSGGFGWNGWTLFILVLATSTIVS